MAWKGKISFFLVWFIHNNTFHKQIFLQHFHCRLLPLLVAFKIVMQITLLFSRLTWSVVMIQQNVCISPTKCVFFSENWRRKHFVLDHPCFIGITFAKNKHTSSSFFFAIHWIAWHWISQPPALGLHLVLVGLVGWGLGVGVLIISTQVNAPSFWLWLWTGVALTDSLSDSESEWESDSFWS